MKLTWIQFDFCSFFLNRNKLISKKQKTFKYKNEFSQFFCNNNNNIERIGID
jgi:hypothetical protein